MKETTPSVTALLVAFARSAYTSAPAPLNVAPDPVAGTLLPAGISHLARATAVAWRIPALTHGVLHAAGLGFLHHVALRTAAIDGEVAAAFSRWPDDAQLVVLGAGLDSRAWRLDALSRANVFEVDHPATQGYKRSHTAALRPMARSLRFVTVNFERDSLQECLAAAGHRTDAPTFWLWEGVTQYLHPAAIRATLTAVRARSSASSRLALTYATEADVALAPGISTLLHAAARIAGESLHGLMPSRQMHTLVEEHGFTVCSDTDGIEWATRFAPTLRRPPSRARERLLVAQVPGAYTSQA